MKQIIKEVFEAEQKVNEILKQARSRATEIRRSAEKENSEKVSEAKRQAREIIQSAVEEAKKEAEQLRREELKQAEQEEEDLLRSNEDAIDNLVDHICRLIISTEYDGEGS
jgi:vacuolar-type H+-ATPase subunit E/Vma4